jgi:uncharacterized damage-inducible protein DinB
MKTIFQAFAGYNGSVNRSILEIVEPLKKEQVMMEKRMLGVRSCRAVAQTAF